MSMATNSEEAATSTTNGHSSIASALEDTENGHIDEPERTDNLHEPQEENIRTSTGNTLYTSAKRFEELPISEDLLKGLYTEMKFEKPSRIQAVTLPMVLKEPYKGLVAQAHNGSGKTTCFVLAMLSRVDPSLQAPQALCVCPTRELVIQNVDVLQRMAKYTQISAISTAASDMETPRGQRINQHVVIGTHGKLKGWMSKRMLDLQVLRIFVLDEADEMLKQDGFASDSIRMINSIRKDVPQVQILLFSATFSDRIKAFALRTVGQDANQVFVPKEELSLEVIKQYKVICESPMKKLDVLHHYIFPLTQKVGQTIIFVRTRETARQLHSSLEHEGHKCTSISGELEMSARDRVVNEFREGKTRILIATDVLSRGFDVQQVNLVINFNIPTERDNRTPAYETYLHRIGRSGRFGRKGAAFNLLSGTVEAQVMDSIEEYFDHRVAEIPSDDEDKFEQVLVEAGLSHGIDG